VKDCRMHWITDVKYEGGYVLRLVFEDGSVRRVDLENHLDGEVFEALKAPERFRTARLNEDIDTVVWDNGADMSPEFLYKISTPLESQHLGKVAENRTPYDGDDAHPPS